MYRIRVFKLDKKNEKYYRSYFKNPSNKLEEVNQIIVDDFNESCDIADIISNDNENLLVCVFKENEKKVRVEEEIEISKYSVTGLEI